MTCSSCDDYRFVPGADGMLVRCLDCFEHCRAHDRICVVNGICDACVREASVAVELLYEARRAAALASVTAAA